MRWRDQRTPYVRKAMWSYIRGEPGLSKPSSTDRMVLAVGDCPAARLKRLWLPQVEACSGGKSLEHGRCRD